MKYKIWRAISRFLAIFGKDYKQLISHFFKSQGMKIGQNCNILSNINSSEPYLICIGDNVTISNDVEFITHDASIGKVTQGKTSDLFGTIHVGDNCFIGSHSIILYGVSIPKNTIVASGSVVTHSFSFSEEGLIIGGSPAKIIGSWVDFKNKAKNRELQVKRLSKSKKVKAIMDKNYWIVR